MKLKSTKPRVGDRVTAKNAAPARGPRPSVLRMSHSAAASASAAAGYSHARGSAARMSQSG